MSSIIQRLPEGIVILELDTKKIKLFNQVFLNYILESVHNELDSELKLNFNEDKDQMT